MAVTTEFNTGFEYGIANSNGEGLFDLISNATVVSSDARNGSYSLQLSGSATLSKVQRLLPTDAARKKVVGRIAFKVVSLGGSGVVSLLGIFDGISGVNVRVNSATGVLEAKAPGGSYTTGPNVNDGAWHVLETQLDWTSATPTLDWKVDQVSQTQLVGASASAAIDRIELGYSAQNSNGTVLVDDVIFGKFTTTSDWYRDGKGVALLPGSDGTHSFTDNDFSTGDAGTQRASSYTDFYTMVDDTGAWSATRSTTDNIAQRVIRTTGYVEIRPATASSTELPANAIRALMAYSSSATQADKMATIVRNSAGTANVIWGDLPTAQGGNNGALADYSESSNFFKAAMVLI